MKKIERYTDKGLKLGELEINHSITTGFGPHWHEFYEFEIYFSASGYTVINGKKYPLKENMIVFLTPSDIHELYIDNEIEVLNLTFSQKWIENSSFAENTFSNYIASYIEQKKMDWILSITERIEEEINTEKPLKRSYTHQLLSCLLTELCRIDYANEAHSDVIPAIQKAIQYIRLHCLENITLESVSKISGFSTSYMSKLLHKSIGCSFKKYLTDLRLKHAERLLLYSDTPITEIAFLCGFNSLSHFMHQFKEKNHIAPRQFRKIYKKDNSDKS